jgi:DNA sulfur modification protein DndD
MILEKLALTNFGLYGGDNQFDLAPGLDGGTPVILVRGHNGGGKTTFLEAVRLALYGKRALGVRVARSDYEAYLLRRIYALAPERSASVRLEFSRAEEGRLVHYCVTRSWAARGASVIESMELLRGGELVDDMPPEDWDHYLEDMIPSGISQLFFFDGEKIQDIADGASTDGLRDAVRSLLGLDLIDQLRSDLALYTARRDPSATGPDVAAIERDLREAREELAILEESAAQDRADRERADKRILKAQRAFDAEGGAVALDRSGLKQTIREVEKRIDWLQGDLRRLAESPLPLGLAPKLLRRLAERAAAGGAGVNRDAIAAFLDGFETMQAGKAGKRPSWTKGHFDALRKHLDKDDESVPQSELDADPAWIISRIEAIDDELRAQAAKLAGELDTALKRQSRLKKQLRNFDESAVSETLEVLRGAEYDRGRAEAQLAEREKATATLRNRIGQLEKERSRAIDVEFDATLASHKVDLGERARAALAEYEKRVLGRRIEQLSTHFVDCFNGLIRKKRLLQKVMVDPDTFEIALVGEDGVEIPKEALSAGERQIFAISMLWALGQTSGRDLPMIIDTPLSRLDRAHRRALIKDYVPNASRQVILLCTDTELTSDLDKLVSPHVARRYEIGVDQGNRWTEIVEQAPEAAYAHQ